MAELRRWFTHSCNRYEWPFKLLIVLEVGNALTWIALFIWTEAAFESAPAGAFGMRTSLLAAILSHLGTPNTVRAALSSVSKGRLRWLSSWWLLLSLATDVQTVVEVFRHLPNYPGGPPDASALAALRAYGIIQLTLSSLATIAFVSVKLLLGPVKDDCADELSRPLLQRRGGGGGGGRQ